MSFVSTVMDAVVSSGGVGADGVFFVRDGDGKLVYQRHCYRDILILNHMCAVLVVGDDHYVVVVGGDIFEMRGVHVSDWCASDAAGSSLLDAVVSEHVGIYLSDRFDPSRNVWETSVPQVPDAEVHVIRHRLPELPVASSF